VETPLPAYKGDEPYVFVCYAHEDKAAVYPQIAWLHDQGVNIWYDEGISPGQEWSEEIGQAINNAERLLFFVTSASVASRNCRDEIHFAKHHETPILAVYLKETELPAGLEIAIGASQAILAHDLPEAEYRTKLFDVVGTGGAGQTTQRDSAPSRSNATRLRRWAAIVAAVLIVVGMVLLLMNKLSAPPEAVVFDRSVAVSPFTTIGDSPAVGSYAGGMTEELKALLTNYQELRTVKGSSTSNASTAPDVPEASYLINGNIQSLGDRLRLRVRLSRTSDGQSVWSDTYEDAMEEAIADQTQLAATIGRFVRLQLVHDHQCETVRRKSRSAEAAAAYCAAQAETYRNNQVGAYDPQSELSNAQNAIALDPNIVEAYYLVADAYRGLALIGRMDWQEAAGKAHDALDQGLSLDPNDPMLLNIRGDVEADFDLDYQSAEANYRKALAVDPLHPNARWFHGSLGQLALRRGNVAEAIEHYRRSIRLYDSDGRIYQEYAEVLYIVGEHRKAIEAAEFSLNLVASGAIRLLASGTKVQAYLALGEPSQANVAVEDALAFVGPEWRYAVAVQLALVGRSDEARVALASLVNPHPVVMVFTYAALGEHDLAFEWVHKAIDLRGIESINRIRTHPTFTEMRRDARWEDVMKHLEEEEAKGRARH
jgi:TolB-like protein/Tfp pilus assembly protein PilF